MSNNVVVASMKYISVEILWDIVYFPLWWYSKGLVRVGRYCLGSAQQHLRRRLALGIWLKNMFKPMYGDYTKEGRIISFFMRTVVLVWKLGAAVLWLVVLVVIFLAWIALPLLIVCYILYQVFDLPLFITP